MQTTGSKQVYNISSWLFLSLPLDVGVFVVSILFFSYLFLCALVFYLNICPCECVASSGNWSQRHLWTALCVLGIQPGFSGRTTRGLHCWAIFQACAMHIQTFVCVSICNAMNDHILERVWSREIFKYLAHWTVTISWLWTFENIISFQKKSLPCFMGEMMTLLWFELWRRRDIQTLLATHSYKIFVLWDLMLQGENKQTA